MKNSEYNKKIGKYNVHIRKRHGDVKIVDLTYIQFNEYTVYHFVHAQRPGGNVVSHSLKAAY